MTITLPLQPREEAMLVAAAEAKGISTSVLVREAVDRILAETAMNAGVLKRDTRPISEVFLEGIDDVPEHEWAKLPTDGASEHDHYLYGHPKRHL